MKRVCWYSKGCAGVRLKSRQGWLDIPENRHLYISLKRGNIIEVPDDVAEILVNSWKCGINYEESSFEAKEVVEEAPAKEEKKSKKSKRKTKLIDEI